jgi:shikimate 5-dehydrogenase
LAALPRDAAVLEMAYGAAGASPLARAVDGDGDGDGSGGVRGGRYADGLAMLVHQAARAIELALGEAPPLAPLFEAARAAAPATPPR